jgi:uncharacterized membrane protein YoaT (DUF817 family)
MYAFIFVVKTCTTPADPNVSKYPKFFLIHIQSVKVFHTYLVHYCRINVRWAKIIFLMYQFLTSQNWNRWRALVNSLLNFRVP